MAMGSKPHHLATHLAIKGPEDFAAAFNVSRETIERLEIYADMVPRWQKAVNLVARSTLDTIWQRHFADSAQIASLYRDAGNWLDLGSGGGFPGMVVAIMRADQGLGTVTLVESDARKAAFLRDVRRQTGIAVDIVDQRIESPATQASIGKVNVVSARALAPLDRLFELSMPYLNPASVCLFMKGQKADLELTQASVDWQFDCELVPSLTDEKARIAVIRHLKKKTEG